MQIKQNTMKRIFSTLTTLLLLALPAGLTLHAAGTAKITKAEYSCPGQVIITFDLNTSSPVDLSLLYSPDKGKKWLTASAISGDVYGQTTGSGKTIVWDNRADNVRYGGFKLRVVLPPPPEIDCVWINGVCWATRNVDEPGTFVANPEDAGMFYQWNRKTAWAATGAVTGWDSSTPAGTAWEKINDPSPEGYRVPTLDELQKLLDATKVTSEWIIQNGISGRKFTDIATGNSIFLPAAGYRGSSDGALYYAGEGGYYWSSTQGGSGNAYYLYFYEWDADWSSNSRSFGFSVRCVAEK